MALTHFTFFLLDQIPCTHFVTILALALTFYAINPLPDIVRGLFQLLQLQVSRLIELSELLHFL